MTNFKSLLMFFTSALLLSFLAGCNASDTSRLQNNSKIANYTWLDSSNKSTVPFYWYNERMMLPVSINGSDPLRLVFDSGASVTVLFDTPRTRAMNLELGDQLPLSQESDKEQTYANIVNNVTVDIGSMRLEKLTAVFVPEESSPLFANQQEAYFDGAIGYDLLSRFHVEIDYDKMVTTLFEPDSAPINESDWQILPIKSQGATSLATIEVKTQDGQATALDLLIDTGAPDALYLNPTIHPEIVLPEKHYTLRGRSFKGEYAREVGKVDYVNVANSRINNLVTSFDSDDDYADFGGQGILGIKTLRKFNLMFQYDKQRILLKPNHEFEQPTRFDRSGLVIVPHTLGAVVSHVALGSAGEKAGIVKGTVITHFDDKKVDEHTFDELKALLHSDKERISICCKGECIALCTDILLESRI